MKHKNMYYDNRYKYKLNMLEPGLIMMKLIEAHQDKVLNDIAMRENNELEKKYEIR